MRMGGYFQSGPRGNFECYTDASVLEMKAACVKGPAILYPLQACIFG